MMKHNILKTKFLTLALGAALTGIAAAQGAPASSWPSLILNDQPFRTTVEPVNQDGRVLVPLRDIFERLGATVLYNSRNRSITARRGSTVVNMELGSTDAEVNGRRVTLDVPANTIYGSTMVPLRFVSEALGATVNYDPSNGVIRINDSNRGTSSGNRNNDRNDGNLRGNNRQYDGRRDGNR